MLEGWTPTEIGGKAADVFEPPGGSKPKFALLSLHPQNGDSLATDPIATNLLRKHGLACVVPHCGRSWWSDRICIDFDPDISAQQYVLQCVVPWMVARWNLTTRAIATMGSEMGGQGAIRLGLKYPDRFPVVASISGAFDYYELYGRGTSLDELYDSRERCRQDTATLHIDPYRWPSHLWFACDPADEWFRGNDRLHEKLNALGVPHTADLDTSTGGNQRAYRERMIKVAIEFIVNGLERESRRLA